MKGNTLRAVLAAAVVAMLLGGGYAYAVDVGRNDVGTRQIKNKSVRKADLSRERNRAIRRGLTRPLPGSPAAPVPSGKTVRGVIGGDSHSTTTTGSDFAALASLPSPAPHDITDDHVFVNPDAVPGLTSSDTSTACTGSPGNPTALPGFVCIYVTQAECASNVEGYSIMPGALGSPLGFKVHWDCSAADANTHLDATYAYTAP